MLSLWRERVERDLGITDGDWSAVNYDEIDWRHWNEAEKRDLYETMTSGILDVEITNGVETRVVEAHPDDTGIADDPCLRWLAMEALLGELKAEIMALNGDAFPPSLVEEWQQLRNDLEVVLNGIKKHPENPTKGHDALSQEAHANVALSALEKLSNMEAFIVGAGGHDAAFVKETMAAAAHLGFAIGQHAYASLMKPFEKLAVTGQAQTRHLGGNRERANKLAKTMVKARRAFVEQRMSTTSRTGEALTKWLQKELKDNGFKSYSRSTVKEDQRVIGKKLSRPC